MTSPRTAEVTFEARWAAVLARDPASDAAFVYAVRTTGIYCRPTCPSRRPLRANVALHPTPEAAEGAGYRACKRCHPRDAVEA
jgi:AraC family transcriptional regulator of adaptative response/methylated-DNA-[protein]-cysteine methyltransferase